MHEVTIKKFNGWCNRETWLVNLWLTNDENSYTLLQDACRKTGTLYDKADWLETIIRETYDRQYRQGSLWTDLVVTALGRVDWCELIENNLD